MGTIREALVRRATEAGADSKEYLRLYLERHLAPTVPNRYRRLVADVLWQLPEGWDAHAEWSLHISLAPRPRRYGTALRVEQKQREDEGTGQRWVITFYPALLDRLSDAACRWVIAHQFGHVASGLPTGSIVIGGQPSPRVQGQSDKAVESPPKKAHEDAADRLGLKWGFSEERQEFLSEEAKR